VAVGVTVGVGDGVIAGVAVGVGVGVTVGVTVGVGVGVGPDTIASIVPPDPTTVALFASGIEMELRYRGIGTGSLSHVSPPSVVLIIVQTPTANP
jgi:hypothetical protein